MVNPVLFDCSRQVIIDLKALADPEHITRAMSDDYKGPPEYKYNIGDLLVDTLNEYDADIQIKDLKSARVMSNHVEKTYMVEFFDKAICDRFLAATSAAKVNFKEIRPSRTKKQREDLKKARELKQANRQASSTDGESKRKRGDDIHYFHPRTTKPKLAADKATSSERRPSIGNDGIRSS